MLASVLASTKRARPPPPPPPPPPAAAGSQVCLDERDALLKAGHECSSADSSLGGKQPSLSACAMLCARRPGCVYFIYGTGGKKRGDCYVEHTATAACTEGWEADDSDTYELGLPLPADADELKSDDDETEWNPDDEDGADEDDWSVPKTGKHDGASGPSDAADGREGQGDHGGARAARAAARHDLPRARRREPPHDRAGEGGDARRSRRRHRAQPVPA